MSQIKIFTGGSGLLGNAMRKIFPNDLFPPSHEFNVENYEMMLTYISNKKLDVSDIIHMAAFTSPPRIDEDPVRALNTNIIGTANVVKLCKKLNCRLVYISTDYVFNGQKGSYLESDPVHPVNKYAWSKLGGEAAVNLYDNSVVIRTSFGPDEFPYPGAFTDQWTSREKVSDIAEKIKNVIISDFIGTIHTGSDRRTVYEYAKSVSPEMEIKKLSINDMKTEMPKDTSLDTVLYKSIFGEW